MIYELPHGVVHVFHFHVHGVESDVHLALTPGLGCSALLLLLVGPGGLGCRALLLLVGVRGAEAVEAPDLLELRLRMVDREPYCQSR